MVGEGVKPSGAGGAGSLRRAPRRRSGVPRGPPRASAAQHLGGITGTAQRWRDQAQHRLRAGRSGRTLNCAASVPSTTPGSSLRGFWRRAAGASRPERLRARLLLGQQIDLRPLGGALRAELAVPLRMPRSSSSIPRRSSSMVAGGGVLRLRAAPARPRGRRAAADAGAGLGKMRLLAANRSRWTWAARCRLHAVRRSGCVRGARAQALVALAWSSRRC